VCVAPLSLGKSAMHDPGVSHAASQKETPEAGTTDIIISYHVRCFRLDDSEQRGAIK
jgi:hypothetical protein